MFFDIFATSFYWAIKHRKNRYYLKNENEPNLLVPSKSSSVNHSYNIISFLQNLLGNIFLLHSSFGFMET